MRTFQRPRLADIAPRAEAPPGGTDACFHDGGTVLGAGSPILAPACSICRASAKNTRARSRDRSPFRSQPGASSVSRATGTHWHWGVVSFLLLVLLLLLSAPTLPPACRLPHTPAWPRPVRVSPTRRKGQGTHGPRTTRSRASGSPLGCGEERRPSVPRPTLPPCGVRGRCEESSRVQRRRKRSRRQRGRRGGGGEGQAEAVSGAMTWKRNVPLQKGAPKRERSGGTLRAPSSWERGGVGWGGVGEGIIQT